MKEREINLMDLIVEMLLGWRMIIVWMLIGGVVMGIFSYIHSEQPTADWEQKSSRQEMRAELERILTAVQKNNVYAAMNYDNFQDYYSDSLILQMNAAEIPKVELVFWVRADSAEQGYNIEYLYEAALVNGVAQWLMEKEGSDSAANINLSELITISNGSSDIGNNYFNGGNNYLNEGNNKGMSNVLTIQVIHLTARGCMELADQVEEYIEFLHEQFAANIEPHDIILANRSFTEMLDAELLNQQQKMITDITTNKTNAEKLKGAFSKEEQAYYNILKAEAASEGNAAEEDEVSQQSGGQTASNASVSIKYILLGMVLFAFLYIMYLFLKYILNNKLHASDDISEIYGLPQLGSIPRPAARKKFLGAVDNWIVKLRDRDKRTFTVEEATGMAAVAVKMAVKKQGGNEVFCVGCDMRERTQKAAEQIQNILKSENIAMKVLNNILYDQEALEQLAAAKCVFLLETAGGTFYEEIAKEVEVLERQEIKILGGVIVG